METNEFKSIGEIMDEDDHDSHRRMVIYCVGGLIGIGLLFTGYLNFMLYSRAFEGVMKIFGIIHALLIEGSLALFLMGNFFWFAHGTQGKLAKIFGWLMFGIVSFNSLVEFNALVGNVDAESGFLHIYATWGIPIVIPIVIAFWKAVLDADPSINIMRKNRMIRQTIQVANANARVKALSGQSTTDALRISGERYASEVNKKLIGEEPASVGSAPKSLAAPAVQPTLPTVPVQEPEQEIVVPKNGKYPKA